MTKPVRVLHVLEQFHPGGGLRSAIALAVESAKDERFQHSFLALRHIPGDAGTALLESHALPYVILNDLAEVDRHLCEADIVQVEWWNSPTMNRFFRRDLPPIRLVSWCHVGGERAPQRIPPQLIEISDYIIACSPHTYQAPAFRSLLPDILHTKTRMILSVSDLSQLHQVHRQGDPRPTVGYVGTVDSLKIHGSFLELCAAISSPGVRFVVVGGGQDRKLALSAKQYGLEGRIEFKGPRDDVRSEYASFDIFGYPLCEDTYAAAELVLQEAMYCGVVPVVLPYGGAPHLIEHNVTGIIAQNESEYVQAIEHLLANQELRNTLSESARLFAQEHFTPAKSTQALHEVYAKEKRKRRWNFDAPYHTDLLLPHRDEPSIQFLELLGDDTMLRFVDSRWGNVDAQCAADAAILRSSSLLRRGSIIPYAKIYSEDPYLAYWAALAALGEGMPELVAPLLKVAAGARELSSRTERLSSIAASFSTTQGIDIQAIAGQIGIPTPRLE
jgi:glycosyltransferase involved in cell wall biosynthesis